MFARTTGPRKTLRPHVPPPQFLLLLLCAATSCCGSLNNRKFMLAEALGTDSVMSRLKTAQCALQVNVGRIPGTAMPNDWAASGARLGFLLEVEFCEELPSNYQMTKERLLLGSRKGLGRQPTVALRAVEPLNEPTFISTAGQQVIRVTEGAYGCELQSLQSQQYGFRFFLDFPEGAVRNDVELPAERIYFISSCWIKNEPTFQRAQQRYNELDQKLTDVRADIAKLEAESKSSGIFGKALGLRQMTTLVEKKQSIEAQLYELERTYPLQETTRQELLDGPNDILFVKEGVIAVKRFRGAMETREQYHWVGTFSFQEFFEDLDEEEGIES
mmetsp:Transcript_19455/g.55977  ORF Transcript_19455/g.55977 Transcript_19455/m.55977 type:complete len:330 (-) Transcript_19455:35-1024(-)